MTSDNQRHSDDMKSASHTTDTPLTSNESNANESGFATAIDSGNDKDSIGSSRNESEESAQTQPTKSRKKSTYDKMSQTVLVNSVIRRDNELADAKKKKADAIKEAQKDKTQRVELQKEIRQLHQGTKDLNAKVQKLRKDKVELQSAFDAELENVTQQYDNATRDWRAKIDETIYPSLPDNEVRDKFQQLWNDCQSWVKTWYQDHTSEESMGFFNRAIDGCASRERVSAEEVLLGRLTSESTALLKALGLAWVSRVVTGVLLESPFFAFGQDQEALERFYERSKQGEWSSSPVFMTNHGRQSQEGIRLAR